jgi:nucleoid-associated protein YgaU
MARVIVILALLFLITGAIFGLTRNTAGPRSVIDADARTTLPLSSGETQGVASSGSTASGAPVASAQDLVTGLVSGASPAFSSVGVDHKGRASFTGTASPGDKVAVVHDQKVLGKTSAERDGSWTIEFRVPEVREAYELRVESHRQNGVTVEGPQRAVVSPPETSGGLPRITLAGLELPKAPAQPAEAPAASASADGAAAAEPEVGIVIEKVEADGKGAASLRGRSDPGATIKVQLEGVDVGSIKVGADGAWSLQISNASEQMVKTARIVLLSAAGKELDFSEIPLSLVPVAKASSNGSVTAAAAASSTAAAPAAPPVAKGPGKGGRGYYVKVRRGDSLWKLAKRHYGDGRKWTRILKANRKRVGDPDLIRPGRRLYLP